MPSDVLPFQYMDTKFAEKFASVVFILTHLENGQCELLPSLDVCRQFVC
jgi:hypothetical protein